MPTKDNYEDHQWCLDQLKKCQEADHDNREHAREAHLFVDKRDGQWEPHWWNRSEGKPRYTFDQCNAIIDQIYGQMEQTDFDIAVRPQNGPATKEVAQTYDGLVRNIETVSNADQVYNIAGRNMITAGIDGWEVVNKYVDGDSFDQDLVIQRIPDFTNRCWLGPHTEPDGSDAKYGWVLSGLEKDEFAAKYPDRSESAEVSGDREGDAYYYRNDLIMVGQFRYLVPLERDIVLMSNGKVYESDDDFERVRDELGQLGIAEVERRTRSVLVMYTRDFDANGWIDEKPRETIFRHWLNIIPCYAHFKMNEDSKLIYWGVVEKLMDPQRVLNYSLSREIEEGALAPRAKKWMTEDQAEGHEEQLMSLNTNSDPVQFYNHVEGQPAPFETGGAQINSGLSNISGSMKQILGETAGMYHGSMGDNPGLQSGEAIQKLQDKGDSGNSIYLSAREIAQAHTGRILVDAIPRIYSAGRQVRILDADGSYEMQTIGEQVPDIQTGEMQTLNDLSAGKYDVYCTSGPSFKNRQSQTLAAFESIGQYVPGLIEANADIVLANVSAPGMDQAAERVRRQLFLAGQIPPDQMTEEELAEAQAMQDQPPPETPEMVLARAEEGKAQADLMAQQTKQFETQAQIEQKARELAIKQFEAETQRINAMVDAQKTGADIQHIEAKTVNELVEARNNAFMGMLPQ